MYDELTKVDIEKMKAELDEAASLNLSPASPASRPIRKSKTFTAG